jgi:cysteine desulfurase
MVAYLDCNATTPLDPAVREVMLHYFDVEYGNAGSRTHEFGVRAKQAVQKARRQVAEVVDAVPDEVIFTSGATESNNLAILGLAAFGEAEGKKHIVTTAIEHKAVLEPCEELERRGFEVVYIAPKKEGRVSVDDVLSAVRSDTLLVSVMHVNNETGMIQPVAEIAEGLAATESFFHVDAAQSFGKELAGLRTDRVHLISISGHKIYGPKGVGALIVRRRRRAPPLMPLSFGGGQERGLRPGTQPVALIAALGEAAEQALSNIGQRRNACLAFQRQLWTALEPVGAQLNGTWENLIPNTANISFPGVDSEAILLCAKDIGAFSNGSACTSSTYSPSHVLTAMGLERERVDSACRFSWCHTTGDVDWSLFAQRVTQLR